MALSMHHSATGNQSPHCVHAIGIGNTDADMVEALLRTGEIEDQHDDLQTSLNRWREYAKVEAGPSTRPARRATRSNIARNGPAEHLPALRQAPLAPFLGAVVATP